MNQVIELQEIASEIRSENDKIVCHARNMLESALRVGELLAQAKSMVQHGEWTQWVEANCEISDRQARKYMQLYECRDQLDGKTAPEGRFNLSETLKLLSRDEECSEDSDAKNQINAIIEKAKSQASQDTALNRKTPKNRSTIQTNEDGTRLQSAARLISVYCQRLYDTDEKRHQVYEIMKAIKEAVDKFIENYQCVE